MNNIQTEQDLSLHNNKYYVKKFEKNTEKLEKFIKVIFSHLNVSKLLEIKFIKHANEFYGRKDEICMFIRELDTHFKKIQQINYLNCYCLILAYFCITTINNRFVLNKDFILKQVKEKIKILTNSDTMIVVKSNSSSKTKKNKKRRLDNLTLDTYFTISDIIRYASFICKFLNELREINKSDHRQKSPNESLKKNNNLENENDEDDEDDDDNIDIDDQIYNLF